MSLPPVVDKPSESQISSRVMSQPPLVDSSLGFTQNSPNASETKCLKNWKTTGCFSKLFRCRGYQIVWLISQCDVLLTEIKISYLLPKKCCVAFLTVFICLALFSWVSLYRVIILLAAISLLLFTLVSFPFPFSVILSTKILCSLSRYTILNQIKSLFTNTGLISQHG